MTVLARSFDFEQSYGFPQLLWTGSIGRKRPAPDSDSLGRRAVGCEIAGVPADLCSRIRYPADRFLGREVWMQFDRLRRREFITLLGGAVAWPLTVGAQQPGKVKRIGFLRVGAPPPMWIESFRQGLREHGLIEGQSITIELGAGTECGRAAWRRGRARPSQGGRACGLRRAVGAAGQGRGEARSRSYSWPLSILSSRALSRASRAQAATSPA